MKSKFSRTWNSSVKPRKQRKYRYNAPLHLKSKLLAVNLSKELRQKYSTRNIRVRKGDTVRILRGTYKGKEGKVNDVDTKNLKVFVDGIEHTKREGAKKRIPLQPSNLQIVELILKDNKRKQKLTNNKEQEEAKK